MDAILITMNIWHRVEPTTSAVTKAVIHAAETRHTLLLLGPAGKKRMLVGEPVNRFTHDNYMTAAQAGLLYAGKDEDVVDAFAPSLDEETGLPVLMEEYRSAFAKRSYAGKVEEAPKEQQAAMDLNAPAT